MKKIISLILALVMMLGVCALADTNSKETIKAVQQALNEAGYDCGTPDGAAGKKTKNAITQYQTDRGMIATGTITEELLIALGLMGGFDYSVFSGLDSFREDKFDKTWSASSYVKDGEIQCSLVLSGNTDGSVNTFGLYVYKVEENADTGEKKSIYPDKIQFLMDDDRVHTFDLKGMNGAFHFSAIYFNENMLDFIEALCNSQSVQIRLQSAEAVNSGLSYVNLGDAAFAKEALAPVTSMLSECVQTGIFKALSNDAKMTNSVWAQMGYMRYEVK